MRLQVIKAARWSVLGVCDQRGECQVVSFLAEATAAGGVDKSQLQALLLAVALNGPPRNERKSRRLNGPIYELKTRSGIRIPYFYDDDSVVIATEALRKPKATALRGVIERARTVRGAYLRAKQHNELEIVEVEA